MKRFCVGLLISLASIAAVTAADADSAKKDQEQLQGEWAMVSGSADGLAIPDEMAKRFKRICKDDETSVSNGDQIVMRAKFTLDPSKNPKTIDYQTVEGPTTGQKHLGIYELDGDTAKFCFGAPDQERPTDFSSKVGDRRTYSVWKRAKK